MAWREEWSPGGDAVALHLTGDVTIDLARPLHERLVALSRQGNVQRVTVDFAVAARLDSAGVVALTAGRETLEAAGKRVLYAHVSDDHRAAFHMVPARLGPPAAPRTETGLIERLVQGGLRSGQVLLDLATMVVDTGRSAVACLVGRERLRLSSLIEQSVLIGVNAFLIVALLSLLIGVILGFQAAYQLQRFGAELYMAEVVGLGMVREFGAIMAAIILAGRSGAAMAAELGTMAVREELDALRVMGIDPIRYLVLPRILAISVMQPILTLMAMGIGMLGGVGTASLAALPPNVIFDRMQQQLTLDDFWLGLTKSLLFAWIIGFTACFMGLTTRGGAHNVGRHTTRAVVASIFSIVVTDSLVTTIWTLGYA